MNFSGKCNGQIKLSIKPLENMEPYGQMTPSNLNPLTVPLSVDVENNGCESPSSVLSRTLKRKFTELEEITQRLKARLFDVTGDEFFDPDEEFERDLNTSVEMEEFHAADYENFGWLSKSENVEENENENNQPSTSAASRSVIDEPHREISGASNPGPKQPVTLPLSLDNLLKSYDIDTIINPNIFKNILDPNLANSESTPTLNMNTFTQESKNREVAEKDDATTISSNLSPDHLQTIQQALQNASIEEKDDDSLASRPVPEGEQFSSNE